MHGSRLDGENPLWVCPQPLAEGKGVHCEEESEGNSKLISSLRDTNRFMHNQWGELPWEQPAGIIRAVLPQEEDHAKELFALLGESIVPRNSIVAGFAPPYWIEMYKVFATPKPINFTPIISERGTNTEGSLSDMEKVVLSSYGGTRGVASLNMKKLKLWSIYEFTFQ